MNPRQIFMDLPEQASPRAISAYLDEACGNDDGMRTKVEALIAAAEKAGEEFLEQPPVVHLNPDQSPTATEGRKGSEPSDVIDNFKLLQKIGEGGFGEVYMAEQLAPLKRMVALKIIKLGMDTRQVVARFEAERQALAMMDHPSIARVFDAGSTETGRPYFVMELVRGVPITRFCDEQKLNTEERMRLFIQVCHAVQHAHQKGIIHRDLKPSNVMVTMHDDKAVPKVIDFGIAKATQVDLTEKTLYTRYAQFIGTPAYTSPEQAQMSGLDIDTRSDIYSLGVLLYELLTGRPPFDPTELVQAGQNEMRRVICEEEPPRPSTRLSALTIAEQSDLAMQRNCEPGKLQVLLRGDLDWIVMKALEKDRVRRYETATGLAADVGRALADEPVEASPPSLAYKSAKMIRRHRIPIGIAALLVLILVASTVFSLRGWKAAVVARNDAKAEVVLRKNAQDQTEEKNVLLAFLRAEELMANKNGELGVAQLASIARKEAGEPIGTLAAQRIGASLRARLFPLPDRPPVAGSDVSPVRVAVGSDRTRAAMLWWAGRTRLWNASEDEVREMGNSAEARDISLSPNNRWVALPGSVLGADGVPSGQVEILDAETGNRVGQVLRQGWVPGFCVFSPDERWILTGDDDFMIHLWEYDSQSDGFLEIKSERLGEAVVSGDFAPDGKSFAVSCYDGTVRIWALSGNEWKEKAILKHGEGTYVRTVRFSPDGERIASGCAEGNVCLWDATTRQCLARMKHDHLVNEVVFDSTGTVLASASFDKTARLWKVDDGLALTKPLLHGGNVTAVRFNARGNRLLTASDDASTRVWDVITGQQVGPAYKQGQSVTALELGPDGEQFLTGGGGEVRWWRSQPLSPGSMNIRHTFRRGYFEQGGRTWASFSPDGTKVLSFGVDGRARLSEAATGRRLQLVDGETGCFSPDGRLMATSWSMRNREERGFEVSSGFEVRTVLPTKSAAPWRVEDLSEAPYLLAFDSKTRLLAVSLGLGTDWKIAVYDIISRNEVMSFPVLRVRGLEFSPDPDRSWLLVSHGDGSARILDADSGKEVSRLDALSTAKRAHHSKFSADGKLVVTMRGDNSVVVWEAASGKMVFDGIRFAERIHDARLSPDNMLVAIASSNHTARLWNLKTGKAVGLPMRHNGSVLRLSFSRDGGRLATCSKDGIVRIWDTRYGLPLSEPLDHGRWSDHVEFSADGRHVLATDRGAVVRIWETFPDSSEVPTWFPKWAEAIAGQRLGAEGTSAHLDWKERQQIFEEARRDSGEGPYHRLARWLHEDPQSRPISPFKAVSRQDAVDRLLNERNEESVREAIAIDPENGIAMARLAVFLRDGTHEDDAVLRFQADHYARLAERSLRGRLEDEPDNIAVWGSLLDLDGSREILSGAVRASRASRLARELSGDSIKALTSLLERVAFSGVADREFDIAREALEELIALTVDSSGRPHYDLKLASLFLWMGDQSSFESQVQTMIARYGDRDEFSWFRTRLARCSLAHPLSADADWFPRALIMSRHGTEGEQVHPWDGLTRGIGEYRSGNYKEALPWLHGAEDNSTYDDFRAIALSYLAMAKHRLGELEGAREVISRAQKISLSLQNPGQAYPAKYWQNWVHALIVMKEAQLQINGAAADARE